MRERDNVARWIFKLEETKGYSKAVVAIANKLGVPLKDYAEQLKITEGV